MRTVTRQMIVWHIGEADFRTIYRKCKELVTEFNADVLLMNDEDKIVGFFPIGSSHILL